VEDIIYLLFMYAQTAKVSHFHMAHFLSFFCYFTVCLCIRLCCTSCTINNSNL